MNVAIGIRRLTALAFVASMTASGVAAVRADEGAAAQGTAPLRWTPHRAAANADPLAASSAAAPEAFPAASPRPSPPATLAPVPDSAAAIDTDAAIDASPPAVTPRAPRPAPRMLPPAPPAPAPWPSANRAPGTSRGTIRPESARGPAAPAVAPPRLASAGEPSLFGMSLFRAPQGDVGRPVFASEEAPLRDGVRPAAAGSETLRFTPRQVGAVNPRIASAPGGGPSVVAQLPGSSMPTSSMPRRVPVRRVANQPTPAGELPPPAGLSSSEPGGDAPSASSPSRAGRPTPADPIPEGSPAPGGMALDEEGLSFGGPDGDIGYGDYPGGMGGPMEGEDGYGMPGFGMPEEGMIYSEDGMPMGMGGAEGPWMGDVQLHIPSFYDDPYACEDGEACPGCFPMWDHDGRICAWFRRFGRPYYGWRWYRDFTASAGVTSFQSAPDLGLHGNFGFNEYANWAMPFWNAFGVGWQVGVRGVQANFQPTQLKAANGSPILNKQARDQIFLTTGFFTRAFEGRGLQGGAVYDYLRDNWYDTADFSQVRGELSYVWGYNEFGFWGAFNSLNTNGIVASGAPANSAYHDTLDLYTGFYRLQFGDANELKIWGGASGQGDNLLGALVRAPMSRSLALEGTFTYLIPRTSNTVTLPSGQTVTYSEQAWNMSANIVWYPACRARRSLASPYRPLFDVADNGSMIRSLTVPRRR